MIINGVKKKKGRSGSWTGGDYAHDRRKTSSIFPLRVRGCYSERGGGSFNANKEKYVPEKVMLLGDQRIDHN